MAGVTRVRFAPSPTGHLHLGGLRTALYNYLFARKTKGKAILRIEDTDQTRLVPGSAEALESMLEWAGMTFDETPKRPGAFGPYVQSARLDTYRHYADHLLKTGAAYRCYCSPERLDALRGHQGQKGVPMMYDKTCRSVSREPAPGERFTVRLKIPMGNVSFKDEVHGHVTFSNAQMDDQILLKSDGFPTYHLANVVDDHLMGITHVIRGEEWMTSVPKHILLYEGFGWRHPSFAHLPLLLNEDGTKLSKRQGDVFVEQYKDAGFLPEALVNFVGMLGWAPRGTQEIFSIAELADHFNLSEVNKAGAIVNRTKLRWMNKQHMTRAFASKGASAPPDAASVIRERCIDALGSTVVAKFGKKYPREYLGRVIAAMKERVSMAPEIASFCEHFFIDIPNLSTSEAVELREKAWLPNAVDILGLAITKLESLPPQATDEQISGLLDALSKEAGVQPKQLMLLMRYALTGTKVGTGIAQTIATISPSLSSKRLAACVSANA